MNEKDCGVTVTNAATELNIVRKEEKPCHLRLDIEVPVTIVQDSFKRALDLFRAKAKIPGFRPGKTPDKLIKRRFRAEISEEVKRMLVEDSTRRACEQEEVVPETMPRVENEDNLSVNENEAFVYAVTFDVAPDFELPEYKNITVTTEAGEVGEEDVNEVIDNWLQQRATFESVDRAAEDGDLLKVTYQGELQEADVELSEDTKFFLDAEETWLALREPEIIPGASAVLRGAEPGSKHEADLAFPEDFAEESLRGKTVHYKFHVLEVHAAAIPKLEEVADQVGAEDAEQVRQQVRQRLTFDRQRQKEEAVRQQVVQTLMDQVDFPLPPNMLARDTYQVFARLYESEMSRGKNEEDLKSEQSELMKRASETAKNQLKRFYIFSRIADKEEIKVERQDLDQMLTSLSQYHKMKPEVLRRRLEQSGRLVDLVMNLRENKAVNFVVSQANVVETETKEE